MLFFPFSAICFCPCQLLGNSGHLTVFSSTHQSLKLMHINCARVRLKWPSSTLSRAVKCRSVISRQRCHAMLFLWQIHPFSIRDINYRFYNNRLWYGETNVALPGLQMSPDGRFCSNDEKVSIKIIEKFSQTIHRTILNNCRYSWIFISA